MNPAINVKLRLIHENAHLKIHNKNMFPTPQGFFCKRHQTAAQLRSHMKTHSINPRKTHEDTQWGKVQKMHPQAVFPRKRC